MLTESANDTSSRWLLLQSDDPRRFRSGDGTDVTEVADGVLGRQSFYSLTCRR
jgi:hypothetical protein